MTKKNNAVLQNSVKNKNRESERKAFLGEKLSLVYVFFPYNRSKLLYRSLNIFLYGRC